ncbi:MAG TPA: DoxX family protein [Candidatus Moranbacteria bacterium]|nr:DoxX family protein [Candidatus Moranbacteria bacterium]
MEKISFRDMGLLLLRLGPALSFMAHGWAKFANVAGTTAFFAKLELASPFVYLVATVELLGGAALLVGKWTRVAGMLLAVNMFFAIFLVKRQAGFLGGYELELVLLLFSLGIALVGPGGYAWGGIFSKEKA